MTGITIAASVLILPLALILAAAVVGFFYTAVAGRRGGKPLPALTKLKLENL